MKIKIIKQKFIDSCVAAVLAMMVNESEQYVLDWFPNQEPPFNDLDAFIFLAHHGIFLSLELGCDGSDLSSVDYVTAEIRLDNRMAYLIVESKSCKEKTHAVLWNGKKVLDPLHNTSQPLSNYKIRSLYPMTVTEERYNINFKD